MTPRNEQELGPRRQRWDVALRSWLEDLLARWGRVAAQRPAPPIVVMALLAAAFTSQLSGLRVETSVENFLRAGHPTRVAYESFRDQYGRDEFVALAVEPRAVFDLEFLAELRALHSDLQDEVPHLGEVTSLVNVRETRGEGDSLIVRDLLEKWPADADELEALAERARANPFYRNALLSADAAVAAVVVKTSAFSASMQQEGDLAGFEDDEPRDPAAHGAGGTQYLTGAENSEAVVAIESIIERYDRPEQHIHVAGGPVMEHRLADELGRNIVVFMSLCLLTVGVFLFALFRRLSAVLLPLAVVLLSIGSTFGAMAMTGTPVGIPTQILPSFLLAVGVGGAVHLLTIFFQKFDAGESREDALAGALGHAGLAIIMTGLTTAGALLSFVTAEIEPVAALGWAAPAGILLGLAYCLVLLPPLIATIPLRPRRPANAGAGALITRVLLWTGDQSVSRPWTVMACMSAVLIVSIAGITRLDFRYDPLAWFPEGDPLRRSTEFIDQRMQGSFTLEFLVDTGRENGLHDPLVLAGLDTLAARVAAIEGADGLRAGRTHSIADVVKEIHQALNENRQEFHTIPGDRQLLVQELLLFENSGSDDLEDVVDARFQTARFTILLPYSPPFAFLGYIAQVEAAFRDVLGPELDVTATGVVSLFARSLHAMMASMIRSYGIALLIITPLMYLLLGNFRSGTAAMVPNIAPIIVTLGFMGWTGIPLDVFTLLIGSIAIGLAVDDTIHFMHNFRKRYDVHGDTRTAVRETLLTTGHALLTTSSVLCIAFFIYAFADLQNLATFGILTGFTIAIAFLADVGVSPALMELATRRNWLGIAEGPMGTTASRPVRERGAR